MPISYLRRVCPECNVGLLYQLIYDGFDVEKAEYLFKFLKCEFCSFCITKEENNKRFEDQLKCR